MRNVAKYINIRNKNNTKRKNEIAATILDIYDIVNWHLSKQGGCWPVLCDYIVGSSLEFIEITCFLKLATYQVLFFYWNSFAQARLTCYKIELGCLEVTS